jgi:hypothetical protein
MYVLYCIISFYWFSDSEDVSRSKKPEKLDYDFFVRLQTSVGVVLEIAPNPCWLSGWFSGLITMVLTTTKEMVLIHNHSSQKN